MNDNWSEIGDPKKNEFLLILKAINDKTIEKHLGLFNITLEATQ
jgi:hypothetical protein